MPDVAHEPPAFFGLEVQSRKPQNDYLIIRGSTAKRDRCLTRPSQAYC